MGDEGWGGGGGLFFSTDPKCLCRELQQKYSTAMEDVGKFLQILMKLEVRIFIKKYTLLRAVCFTCACAYIFSRERSLSISLSII